MREDGVMARWCSRGHEVRSGVAFCTECGTTLDTPPDGSATDPAKAAGSSPVPHSPPKPGSRRCLIGVGIGCVALVGLVAVLVWPDSGGSQGDENKFVSAVRAASPDTTSTLTDDQILVTGWSNCEMAENGTLATKIEKAEAYAKTLGVKVGTATKTMTFPLTYLCPEHADALDADASTLPQSTTRPTERARTTTVLPTTTEPVASTGIDEEGRLIARGSGIGPVEFGDSSEDALAALIPILGQPDVESVNDPYCANPSIVSIRLDGLLLTTDREGDVRWYSTDGSNFALRNGMAIGDVGTGVEQSMPAALVPGDDMYPPQWDVTSGEDKGLHIGLSSSDDTITGFFAGGEGLDCVGEHES